MPADKIFLTFLGAELLFLVSGAVMIGFALTTIGNQKNDHTVSSVASDLLLEECPLQGAVGNAVVIFVTFLASVPAMVIPTTRGWLKVHGYMVVFCGIFTLALGLDVWIRTLRTRENLGVIWNSQSSNTQSLIQQELSCCGYFNSTSPPFVQDNVCRNPQIAASLVGCVKPFSSFANNFLDIVFTAAFGMVGLDALLILMIAILAKDRKEKARYRHIDEKNGAGVF